MSISRPLHDEEGGNWPDDTEENVNLNNTFQSFGPIINSRNRENKREASRLLNSHEVAEASLHADDLDIQKGRGEEQ